MSEVHGYTQSGAIARMPESMRGGLTGAIGQLSELGVGGTTAPPDLTLGEQITARRSVRTDLEDTLGKTTEKAKDLSHMLDMNSMGGRVSEGLHERLEGLSEKDMKTLKSQLHYSGFTTFFSRSTPEDRLTTRAAIVSAFAQGASLEETGTLRRLLDSSNSQTRKDVLTALEQPGANPSAIIAKLQRGESLAPPPPVTQEQRNELFRYIQQSGSGFGRGLEVLGRGEIDLTGLDSEQVENVRMGLVSIGAYTGDGIYRSVNDELRAHGEHGTPLSPTTQTLVETSRLAMSRLPDFQGIVMRGGGSGWTEQALQKYVPGERVTEHSFVSSSANGGFPGEIQFVIESHHGKEITDISSFGDPKGPDGREVLFAPGTQFDVLDRSMGTNDQGKQVLYIVMREVG